MNFLLRRYIRLLPVHWLCIILYTPVIYYNYESIAEVGHGGSHKC